jgi:UDP-GlcNAc3NAcA epimerase
MSTLLFCPTAHAQANLATEGITSGVSVVGDVMRDVLLRELALIGVSNDVAKACGLRAGEFALVTVHRAVNTDDPALFEQILTGVGEVARNGLPVIWPVHPRLRDRLSTRELPAGVHLVEPVSYRSMLALLRDARVVVTDSGGLQKEALWMGKPCVTMRDETEWVETVTSGWNVLVGANATRIATEVLAAVAPSTEIPSFYGDGHAAEQIVDQFG